MPGAPLALAAKLGSTTETAAAPAGSTVVPAGTSLVSLALRALLKPEKFDALPRRAKPSPKLVPYYTDDAKRGEFSSLVQARKVRQAAAATE